MASLNPDFFKNVAASWAAKEPVALLPAWNAKHKNQLINLWHIQSIEAQVRYLDITSIISSQRNIWNFVINCDPKYYVDHVDNS